MMIPPPLAAEVPTSCYLCHLPTPPDELTWIQPGDEAQATCLTCLQLHRDADLAWITVLEHAASEGCWRSDDCCVTRELLNVYRDILRGRVAIGGQCAEKAAP